MSTFDWLDPMSHTRSCCLGLFGSRPNLWVGPCLDMRLHVNQSFGRRNSKVDLLISASMRLPRGMIRMAMLDSWFPCAARLNQVDDDFSQLI